MLLWMCSVLVVHHILAAVSFVYDIYSSPSICNVWVHLHFASSATYQLWPCVHYIWCNVHHPPCTSFIALTTNTAWTVNSLKQVFLLFFYYPLMFLLVCAGCCCSYFVVVHVCSTDGCWFAAQPGISQSDPVWSMMAWCARVFFARSFVDTRMRDSNATLNGYILHIGMTIIIS